jgi:hypothetical protein
MVASKAQSFCSSRVSVLNHFEEGEMKSRTFVATALALAAFGSGGVAKAANSQKATQFVSTELVYRFNWFGR